VRKIFFPWGGGGGKTPKILKEIFATPLRITVAAFLILCLTSGIVAGSLRIGLAFASASMVGQNTTIYNYTDLVLFRDRVNAGVDFTGRTITQAADIDMAGLPWTGIGTARNPFRGTFDGNGYRIMNLTAQTGLFNFVFSGEIRNVHMVNVNIHNLVDVGTTMNTIIPQATGAIVGSHWIPGDVIMGAFNILNCTVNGGTVHGQGTTGGLIGTTRGTTISGCSVVNTTVSSTGIIGNTAGGIAGNLIGNNASVSNSYFNGTVSATSNLSDVELSVGGIAGQTQGDIRDCYVEGFVQTTEGAQRLGFVGGIAGTVTATNRIIERNYSSATVTARASSGSAYASGIVGALRGSSNVSTTVRNNAILSQSITAPSGNTRVQAEVCAVNSPSTMTASNNHKINTLFPSGQPATTPASVANLTRPAASHTQTPTWFQTQSSYTTAGNWTGGAWNFSTNWIMSNNTTAGGVNRPLPQAYVNNVLNYQVKEPLFNPNDPQNIIRNLEGQIADLTDVSNQLAADLALERAALVIERGKLEAAEKLIEELRADLKEFLDNPHVCPKPPDPEECECSPPAEPCVCECTDCDDMQELRDRIGALEIERAGHISTIASISATIEGMLEQDGSDGGTLEGLLAELQAMIAELQSREVDINPSTFDFWLFVSVALATGCAILLLVVILLSRRKMSLSVTHKKVEEKK